MREHSLELQGKWVSRRSMSPVAKPALEGMHSLHQALKETL